MRAPAGRPPRRRRRGRRTGRRLPGWWSRTAGRRWLPAARAGAGGLGRMGEGRAGLECAPGERETGGVCTALSVLYSPIAFLASGRVRDRQKMPSWSPARGSSWTCRWSRGGGGEVVEVAEEDAAVLLLKGARPEALLSTTPLPRGRAVATQVLSKPAGWARRSRVAAAASIFERVFLMANACLMLSSTSASNKQNSSSCRPARLSPLSLSPRPAGSPQE